MPAAETVDYSVWRKLSWDDLQGNLPQAEYDIALHTRSHPNESASEMFLEYARAHPLPGALLTSPEDFLEPHEALGTGRCIRGGNLNMVIPPLEEYSLSPDEPGETPLQELAWNIRRIFSRAFVGVDIHGGPSDAEDYVLLSPHANFAARALARYLIGDQGMLVESSPGSVADSALNTVTYELCLPDGEPGKIYQLYDRLRSTLESGIVNFLGAMDPDAGARYDFRFAGDIDYPTARSIDVFWDAHTSTWRVANPHQIRTDENGRRQTTHGQPVTPLGELSLPPQSPLPVGCEDIVGLLRFPGVHTKDALFMSCCVPGGTQTIPALGYGWYGEVMQKSHVNHSIKNRIK